MQRNYKIEADEKTIAILDNLMSMLHYNGKRVLTYAFEFNGITQSAKIGPLPVSVLAEELNDKWDFFPRITNAVLVDEDSIKPAEMKIILGGTVAHTAASGTTATLPSAIASGVVPSTVPDVTPDPEELDPTSKKINEQLRKQKEEVSPSTPSAPKKSKAQEEKEKKQKEHYDKYVDPSLQLGSVDNVKGIVKLNALAEYDDLSMFFVHPFSKIKKALYEHGLLNDIFEFPTDQIVNFYESKDPLDGDDLYVEQEFPLEDFISIDSGKTFNQIVLATLDYEDCPFLASLDYKHLLWMSDGFIYILGISHEQQIKYNNLTFKSKYDYEDEELATA